MEEKDWVVCIPVVAERKYLGWREAQYKERIASTQGALERVHLKENMGMG